MIIALFESFGAFPNSSWIVLWMFVISHYNGTFTFSITNNNDDLCSHIPHRLPSIFVCALRFCNARQLSQHPTGAIAPANLSIHSRTFHGCHFFLSLVPGILCCIRFAFIIIFFSFLSNSNPVQCRFTKDRRTWRTPVVCCTDRNAEVFSGDYFIRRCG